MRRHRAIVIVLGAVVALSTPAGGGAPPGSTGHPPLAPRADLPASLILQGRSTEAVAAAVRDAGATVTHDLSIIRAVAADLTPAQLARALKAGAITRVFPNLEVKTAGGPDTYYPARANVQSLHSQGYTGKGVTVAVLDTGIWNATELMEDSVGNPRVYPRYDATRGETTSNGATDYSGHGTHVTGTILSSRRSSSGKFVSVAPDARLVVVKAFKSNGAGTYADVIRGINWVISNRSRYGIRVLNCSFSARPRSHYWDDPLNQAVMMAWYYGIVVVASGGNGGPGPQTVGVPGNVPYVITVGAMTDNYTPQTGGDDRLASFSASGPTFEGFVKPDLVAPGGHVIATMSREHKLGEDHPEAQVGNYSLFSMSGTSQAAAVVSGVVALMLDRQSSLTPNQVKCRLMASARPALDPEQNRAYSIFQQGAGLVHAKDAAYSSASNCANRGLNLYADLTDQQHYGGRGNQDNTGGYYVMGYSGSGYTWNGGFPAGSGFPWTDGYPWSADAYLWSEGYPWTAAGYSWVDGYPWTVGYPWSTGLVESVSVNSWVDPE
jgi:serine protease AprX